MEVVVLLASLAASVGAPMGLAVAYFAREELRSIAFASGVLRAVIIVLGTIGCLIVFRASYALPISLMVLLTLFFHVPDAVIAALAGVGVFLARASPVFYLAPGVVFLYLLVSGMGRYHDREPLSAQIRSVLPLALFPLVAAGLAILPL